MENRDTGYLLNKDDITLFRGYFQEMVEMLGIQVLYRTLRESSKNYDLHGELDALYNPPITVGCLFEEHTDQKTMKKLGWNVERDTTTPVIHVPYDTPGLESGCLFIIPSGLDHARGRVFKVIDMHNSAVYPASIACVLGPVLESTFERSQVTDFNTTNFNLLVEEDEEL